MFSGVRDFSRRLRAVAATYIFRTQVAKWQKVAQSGPPTWDERNDIISRNIPAGSSVIDLGSGAQTLRGKLAAGCTYQPCDVVQSSPDILLCDFNRDLYPETNRAYDYVVCSGVLEYIWKPDRFLARLPELGHKILLSYNPRMDGEAVFDRLAKNWVNHLTRQSLEKEFDDAGLAWKLIHQRPPNEHLYLLSKA